MTDADLRDLIARMREVQADSVHVEAKRAERDLPQRLWQTISAFSNTVGGGVIVLGVDESSGFQVTGVQNPKKLQQDLASVCDQMEPPVRPVIEFHRLRGRTLVTAEIPEIPVGSKPCYYRGAGMTNGAFIRVADGDRRLGQYEIHLLLASRGQPREDEEPVPEATPADLDAEIVQALAGRLKRTGHPRRRQLGDEEILRLLKALVRHEDRWVPSLAGLMVLGKHPQQFLPGLGVTFVAYPTSRMGEPGPGGERFLDNRRLEGPIPRIVIPALDALRRNMRRRTVVRGLFREELWEYPETAVREALVNALGHRDLSAAARGTPVQIQMYPDRLVILNPGGLFGPVTVDLLGAEGVSSARNATLMRLLEDTPVPGEGHAICENRGSGIGAMRAALRQAGMSLPVFEDRIATFQVAFSNKSLLDEETLRRLERYREHELSDTQRLALAHMLRGATLTNSTYRQLTEVDSRVATKELNGLRAMGIIERTGARRRAAYRLSSRPAEVSARPEAPARRGDRGEAILDLLEREGPLSRAEIARSLGISDGAARLWLSSLRRKNLVELTTRRPRSPRARYRISRPGRKRGHPS